MSGSYGYYSGIIFRAYTYGTGDAVVRGGRYDHLLGKFGKNTPSIGFAIIVDELMSALNRQKIPRRDKLPESDRIHPGYGRVGSLSCHEFPLQRQKHRDHKTGTGR